MKRKTLMPLNDCSLLTLQTICDQRGNIGVVEANHHVPFDIKRVYYLYDVPGGTDRGGHAHRKLRQLIIPLAGSFDITLDDGAQSKTFHMKQANQGLFICPGIWRVLNNFSSGSVCMVLASDHYDESDYYRNYDDFISDIRKGA